MRWIDKTYGSPNGVDFFGIAGRLASRRSRMTYASVSAQSQISSRWQSTVRVGVTDQAYHTVNPTLSGTPSDPSAFGRTSSATSSRSPAPTATRSPGRAILDFSGTYPLRCSTRRVHAASTVRPDQLSRRHRRSICRAAASRARARHFRVRGIATETHAQQLRRASAKARASLADRVCSSPPASASTTTRSSARRVAARLGRGVSAPADRRRRALGDTKLTFNAGKGIKEPNLSQELSSLFVLIPPATALAAWASTPIGPERGRNLDVGIEQGLWRGRGARARRLLQQRVLRPDRVRQQERCCRSSACRRRRASAPAFGAYVNSQSYDAQGVEMSGEATAGRCASPARTRISTPIVTQVARAAARSRPAINPAFPGIPIGNFSPLVGAAAVPASRELRQPARCPTARRAAQVALTGYFVGKPDDSTFLSDGSTSATRMLLPNQDLDAGYQKVDVSGVVPIHPRLKWYATIENLLDQHVRSRRSDSRRCRVGVADRRHDHRSADASPSSDDRVSIARVGAGVLCLRAAIVAAAQTPVRQRGERHRGMRRSLRSRRGLLSGQGDDRGRRQPSRVEYRKSYKVVTVKEAYVGGPAERYVLVQCGAPAPALAGELAGAQVVTVPITSLFVFSTTHLSLLADLGRVDVLTGVAQRDVVMDDAGRSADQGRQGRRVREGRAGDRRRARRHRQAVAVDGRRHVDSGAGRDSRPPACRSSPTRSGWSRPRSAAPSG